MRVSRTYVLGLFLFTLSWLAYNHYRPWVNFHSEMLAFAGLMALVASVSLSQPNTVVVPRLGGGLSLVAMLPWLQQAGGITFFGGDALLSSLYLCGLLAAVCVGYAFAGTDQAIHCLTGLMHALWIAAMLSASIGLAQWLNVDGPMGVYVVQSDVGDRAMGNLGQANQLATLLLMGMAAYAYVFERQAIGRFTFGLGIGFMTGVLILTQSRTGMLSALVVAIYLLWRKRVVQSRLSAKAVWCWVALFLVGTVALPHLSELLLQGDVRSMRSTENVHQRLRMWQQVVYAVAQEPWFGYGWNQTPTAHAAGAIAFPGYVTFSYAHNFVLDMLAWNGLPMGILLIGGIAYWFVTRILSSVRLDAVHAMACLLPLAVHSMLEYPFAYAYFLIAGGLMVGVVEAARVPVRPVVLTTRWVWAFWLVWLPVGFYLAYEYFLIEEDFRVVRFENLNLGKTPAAYEIPDVWVISHMAAMLKARRLPIEPNMPAEDLENLRRVSQRFADNVPHCRYALALALNSDATGAGHQFGIIKGMYGDAYHAACQSELRRLQTEKFPQLAPGATP